MTRPQYTLSDYVWGKAIYSIGLSSLEHTVVRRVIKLSEAIFINEFTRFRINKKHFGLQSRKSLCLQFANKAFGRFPGNADPIQPDTHLSNAEIAKWIVKESNHQN